MTMWIFHTKKKFWCGCNEISETVKIGGIIHIYGLVWPEVTRSRWSEQLVWFGFYVNFFRGWWWKNPNLSQLCNLDWFLQDGMIVIRKIKQRNLSQLWLTARRRKTNRIKDRADIFVNTSSWHRQIQTAMAKIPPIYQTTQCNVWTSFVITGQGNGNRQWDRKSPFEDWKEEGQGNESSGSFSFWLTWTNVFG